MSDVELKSWTHAEVRCVSGYRADERPIAFGVDDREVEVRSTRASWREPDYLCFRVEAKDGRIYDLRHHEYDDFWQVRIVSRSAAGQ